MKHCEVTYSLGPYINLFKRWQEPYIYDCHRHIVLADNTNNQQSRETAISRLERTSEIGPTVLTNYELQTVRTLSLVG